MLCGTNGVTYRNVCFLRKVVCRAGTERRVGIAYNGKCKGISFLVLTFSFTFFKENHHFSVAMINIVLLGGL